MWVRLAGDALDQCRRRVQQNLHGPRGRSGDPLFSSRRMLHTGTDLLTDTQHLRLQTLMRRLIASISHGVPAALSEVITLGRTLTKRAGDILAYFDRPGTSNEPTKAINGRLEHVRGTALGFRHLTSYIARSRLETGGFRPQLHRRL